jgi:hypothetical protein
VSAQVACVHVFVVGEQNPVVQSAATLQLAPDAHWFGQPTPQSVSGSVPFLTPSVQLGARQSLFEPHEPVTQSVPLAQPRPCAHLLGQLPPQSTSLSEPFVAPSLHVGAWQMLVLHTLSAQSVPSAQPADTRHLFGHV